MALYLHSIPASLARASSTYRNEIDKDQDKIINNYQIPVKLTTKHDREDSLFYTRWFRLFLF